MRAAKSRRLSKNLYRRGESRYDIVHELTSAGFVYHHSNGRFTVRKVIGDLVFERKHRCHWRVSKIAFRSHLAQSLTTFQGQVSKVSNMTTPLAQNVKRILGDRGVSVVRLGGFRHTRPSPLARLTQVDEKVEHVLNTVVGDVPGYHHSSWEDDLDLQSRGFAVLTEKPNTEFDFDVFYDLFLQMSLELPEEPLAVPAISDLQQLSQLQPSSSSGLMPLNSLYGSCIGTKKQMINSAVAVNVAARVWGGVPGCLPYKPVAKDEVIKKGKKVRTIMIESQPNVLVLRHYFSTMVAQDRKIVQGRAIGLSTAAGSFKTLFMRWFHVYCKHHEVGGWNEFLQFMASQQMSESDKTAWESSTNEVDGMVYLLGLLLQVDIEGDTTLLTRALADYTNPPVQIDGDAVYFAPWRVPSGSYLTAHGNTERHYMMCRWVLNYFRSHGGAGKIGCPCRYCEMVLEVEGFGETLDELRLDLLESFFVMGDDFIGFAYGAAVFNALLDAVFGTTTKNVCKAVFAAGGPEEPDSVEFLRKHFHLDKQFADWNVRCFRAPQRALAKLRYGRARKTKAGFKAALLSAVWDCGDNYWLYVRLREMLDMLEEDGVIDPGLVKKELTKYIKKTPALADIPSTYVPEFAMVLNSDASLIRPLEKVYWAKAHEEQGLFAAKY